MNPPILESVVLKAKYLRFCDKAGFGVRYNLRDPDLAYFLYKSALTKDNKNKDLSIRSFVKACNDISILIRNEIGIRLLK